MQQVARKRTSGFAGMSEERRAECARRGGKRAHALKHAHKWDSAEAKAASLKGAEARAARRRNHREQ